MEEKTKSFTDQESRYIQLICRFKMRIQHQIDLKHGWSPTWKREQPAIYCPSNGLQLHHIHRLAYVHGTGHAPQGSPHKLSHLLHCEHLQQLIKDGWEGIKQGCLVRKKRSKDKKMFVNVFWCCFDPLEHQIVLWISQDVKELPD